MIDWWPKGEISFIPWEVRGQYKTRMIYEKSPQLPHSFSNNYFHPGDVEMLASIKCCGNSSISYQTLYSYIWSQQQK